MSEATYQEDSVRRAQAGPSAADFASRLVEQHHLHVEAALRVIIGSHILKRPTLHFSQTMVRVAAQFRHGFQKGQHCIVENGEFPVQPQH
jgi:hypothetical protein